MFLLAKLCMTPKPAASLQSSKFTAEYRQGPYEVKLMLEHLEFKYFTRLWCCSTRSEGLQPLGLLFQKRKAEEKSSSVTFHNSLVGERLFNFVESTH